MEQYPEFSEDEEFVELFQIVFSNEDIAEADDEFDPDSFDTYINMKVALDQGRDHPQLARVTKRLIDGSGNPIGRRHDNPIIESKLYEVEFSDGENISLATNGIAENTFSQVDKQGHHHVIID